MANSNSTDNYSLNVNQALTPVAASERVFNWHDHASLWFSLGVGLQAVQIGASARLQAVRRKVDLGAALPTLALTSGLAWLTRVNVSMKQVREPA